MIILNSTSHAREFTRPQASCHSIYSKPISERRANDIHADTCIKAHMKGLLQQDEFQEAFIFPSVFQGYVAAAFYCDKNKN
jgi:hypothetical protein